MNNLWLELKNYREELKDLMIIKVQQFLNEEWQKFADAGEHDIANRMEDFRVLIAENGQGFIKASMRGK